MTKTTTKTNPFSIDLIRSLIASGELSQEQMWVEMDIAFEEGRIDRQELRRLQEATNG